LAEIADSWKVWTTDLSTSLWYTIPYENYDEEKGWFFNQAAAVEAIVPAKLRVTSSHG